MDIRGMDEESVVFNLAEEDNPMLDVLHGSTPSKSQSSAAMAFLKMAVSETASTVVATGMLSGTCP